MSQQQRRATEGANFASSFLYCFTQTNIGTYNQLVEKLKDMSEGANQTYPSGAKGSFSHVKKGPHVMECVVAETHVACLLRDGTICRMRYVEEEPGPFMETKDKSDDDAASTSSARSRGSRSASPRGEGEERGPSSFGHSWSTLIGSIVPTSNSAASGSSGLSRFSGRGARIQLLRRRGGGRALMARWPVVPASEVPEGLISQAMAVLQGKSRESVIRELQRTNLDVNQAVNNLLSRDDDDGEHEETIAAFLPSGEELLNLLGGVGAVGEDELEEALGRAREEGGRESRIGVYDIGDPLLQVRSSEIRSLVGMARGGRPSGSSGSGGAEGSRRRHLASTAGKEPTVAVPLLFDEGAQWWAPEEADCRFVQIAGLYSDLLAVDNWGRLHVWAWQSYSSPPRGPHPLEAELGLVGEKIRLIAGKILRASIVTESGKLATWLDRSVSSISSRLEHKAQTFLELAGETVSQLHVCELFSVILTESNKIFWWGMLPFSERKQAILQTHERVRMAKYKCGLNGKGVESIVQGSRVCLRSSPVYTVGTRAVHLQGGEIKCGVLQESVFVSSLSEKCRFKVLGPDRHEESMDTSTPEGEDFIKAILGAKRKHSDDAGTSSGGGDGGKEEFWSLRDVIFMDCLQTLRAGTVVKVDGGYAAVHFPALEPEEIEEASLDNCRLLRKDDLILASEAQSQQTPYFTQESLKRLKSLSCYHPLALACDYRGIHGVFSAHSLVHYIQYNMGTGRFMQNMQFSETTSRYFLRQSPPVQLIPEGAALWLIRDASGGLYPIVKDSVGAMKDPPLLNLPPVTAMCVGPCSTESSVTVLAFKKQNFMQLVLKGDLPMIKHHLEGLADNPRALRSALCEWSGGECNILHVLAGLSKPPDPPMTSSDGGRGPRGVAARTTPHHGRLRELMKHARAMASGNIHSQPPFDPCVWVGDDVEEHVEVTSSTGDAMRCVEWLCSFTASHVVLVGLMKEKNIEGYTPFMAATSYKAYGIALRLFDLALMLSGASEDSLVAMLCPHDSHPDDNPVFVLCRNDTCSFTWTGEEHIHQDIFECRTCGLTGSLCCCTECAYTCHRGHDCSFKRSSPTAYCDCWEKCKCKALVSVSDSQRQSLLIKLLKHTPLGTRVNGRKEHLLGMLVGIVARQAKEQNQWHSLRSSSSYRMHSSKHEDMPPHDLPPPKFAQKALNMVMEDWQCVKTALLAGVGDLHGDLSAQVPPQPKTQTAWGRGCDPSQSCTLSLDALTHTLLTKINQEMLDSLLTRLVRKIGPSRQNKEAVDVCERFLRSVLRVFTTCHIEATNIPSSTLSTSSKKRRYASSTLVERSERVFSSLAPLAVKQLVPMAQALILPVCGGVSRPVDPQCMSDRHRTAEELFRLPALSLLRIPTTEDDHAEGEAGSDTESDGGDGEESTSGGLAHDASSTATIGSNPLYLSDQDSSDGEELESGPDDASIDGDSRPDEDSLMVTHRLTTTQSTSHWALPTVHRTHTTSTRLSRTSTYSSRDCLSMSMSSTLLAQTFSLLVRQLADIMEAVQEHLHSPTPPSTLPTLEGEPESLAEFMWAELHEVWVWLFSQLDTVECQIRLGTSVEGKVSDRATLSRSESSTEILESRKDFLSYLLSLMRGQHREHGGVLPAIDVSAMEHLAWTMDALYYLLKNTQPSDSTPMDVSTPLNQPEMARFFRRSSSTTLLGALPISPFDPLSRALPLADKPHLLDPEHYRPVLFGYDQAPLLEQWPQCCLQDPPIISLIRGTADRGSGLGALWPKRGKEQEIMSNSESGLTLDRVCGLNSHDLAADVLVGRWNSTVRLFARVFGDSVGRARGSYLSEERVFETLERDFRREMDSLRTSCQKEIIIEVERSRDRMIPATFNQLNSFYDSRLSMSTATPPLCVYRVKVSFLNEPGEGSGVLRSLLTAIPEAVLSDDPLPKLDSPLRIKKPLSPSSITISVTGKGKVREKQKPNSKSGSQGSRLQTTERYSGDDPLFYQPGKPGFYAPRCSTNTPERLNAYRNIGRLIGLSLLNCETIPLLLCRHVFKYLMNKEVSWHDLAFFDPVMYESLRLLILDSRGKSGQEHLASQQLTFQVTLRAEEGGGVRELVMHGASLPVTPDNVYNYVRKYAELRMLTVNKEPLQQLRDGVYDVIPENSLVGLSAEYLRLLVSGCPQIDVDLLRGITIFDDESHKSPETLVHFKNWFWSVVERMSQRERQDLLYFWTSSPQLPASMESYQPSPSVTVRPADDQRLPTANTCISRIYIPLYSSKVLLRTRLLMAIKTKTFGFV